MAKTHPKVDVVTIGAGWTSAILGAKLCPKGHDVVALEQGAQRWAYPDFAHDHDSLRYSVRYAMMVDLARETWTWRPTPELAGAADAPVRLVQPGRGPRRRGDPLVGAAVAVHGVRLPPPLAHRRPLRRANGFRRARRSRTGRSTTTSSSPTTTRSSRTSAPRGSPGTSAGRSSPDGNPFEAPRSRGLPASAADDEPLRRHVRRRVHRARAAPVPAAGRDPLARLDRPIRQPPLGLPLLRLLHPFRLRGRREGEPAERPISPLPSPPDATRCGSAARCSGSRPAANGLATGVTYVDGKAQEHFQPADVVVVSAFTLENNRLLLLSTRQEASTRDRQRPRPRRAELHVPDLPGAVDRPVRGREAEHVHGQHLHDQRSSTTTTETTSTTPTSTSSAACSSTRSPASASRSTP